MRGMRGSISARCGDIRRIELSLLSLLSLLLLLLMLFGQNSWLNQDVLHIPQGTFFSLRSANDQLSFWTLAAWCCGKPYYSGAEPSVRLSFGTRNEFPVEQLQKVSIDQLELQTPYTKIHCTNPLGFRAVSPSFTSKPRSISWQRNEACCVRDKPRQRVICWVKICEHLEKPCVEIGHGKIGRSMCSFAWQGFAKYKLFRCCQFRARRFEGPSCLQELAEPCWTCNVRWDSYRPRKLDKISKSPGAGALVAPCFLAPWGETTSRSHQLRGDAAERRFSSGRFHFLGVMYGFIYRIFIDMWYMDLSNISYLGWLWNIMDNLGSRLGY